MVYRWPYFFLYCRRWDDLLGFSLLVSRRGKGLHMVDFIYQHLNDRGGLAVTLFQLLNARGQVLLAAIISRSRTNASTTAMLI